MREIIDNNIKLNKIINDFLDNGFEIYFVGGVVRDYLLHREIHDIDFTTSASPSDVIELLKEDYKLSLNGLKHGTVGVIIDGKMYEITTFRTEGGYLDKRHPDYVRFVKNIYEDLARRDFTINALAVSLQNDNEVIDYFDGISDLNNHIIRTVLNPDRRFTEDALRILRALRFASSLSFEIEEETEKSIVKNYHLLKDISSERIVDEIKRMIVCVNFKEVFLKYSFVFEFVLELELNEDKIKEIYHSIDKLDNDFERLALLFKYSKDESGALTNLRFSNFEKKVITHSIEIINSEVLDDRDVRMLFRNYSNKDVLYGLRCKGALDGKSDYYLDLYNKNIDKPNRIKSLKVNGYALIRNKVCKKNIGRILNKLLDEVINGDLENEYDVLIERSKQIEADFHLQNDQNLV